MDTEPSDSASEEVLDASAPSVSRGTRKKRIIATGLLLLLILAILLAGWIADYTSKHMLAPSGGLYFFSRVELAVPGFAQADPLWHHDLLAYGPDTMGSAGCAVSSAAMVLKFYGVQTNPQELNWYLQKTGGFTPEGWMYWEAAAELAPGSIEKAYEDAPSYALIDWNLVRGNPVIIRIRFPSGTTHFVVIAGKQGYDYLIRDPGGGATRGIYPLRDLGRPIEALRYYRVLKPLAGPAERLAKTP